MMIIIQPQPKQQQQNRTCFNEYIYIFKFVERKKNWKELRLCEADHSSVL